VPLQRRQPAGESKLLVVAWSPFPGKRESYLQLIPMKGSRTSPVGHLVNVDMMENVTPALFALMEFSGLANW
jgi:hypothetical protein